MDTTTDTPIVSAEEIVALMPPSYVHVAREAALLALPSGWSINVFGEVAHIYSPKRVTLPSITGPVEVPEHVARIHYYPEHAVLTYDRSPLGEYVQRPAEWLHIGGGTDEGWPTLQAAVDAALGA